LFEGNFISEAKVATFKVQWCLIFPVVRGHGGKPQCSALKKLQFQCDEVSKGSTASMKIVQRFVHIHSCCLEKDR